MVEYLEERGYQRVSPKKWVHDDGHSVRFSRTGSFGYLWKAKMRYSSQSGKHSYIRTSATGETRTAAAMRAIREARAAATYDESETRWF